MAVRLIVFTLVALSFVNAYSFVKLYSSTYVSDKAFGDRQPASTQSTEAASTSLKTHLAVDLNCGDRQKPELKAHGHWAQLKGRMCKPKKGTFVVEITNMSNGFTASVFDLGSQQYQTDLIQLDRGSNKIRVRIVSPVGAVEEQTLLIENSYI